MYQIRVDIKPGVPREATVIRREARPSPLCERPRPLLRLLLLALVIAILGGAIFLLTWEIPPPTAPVEITIPDEQLPR